MGAVYFYHLTESSLEATLPMLLGKALAAGWRVEVRGTTPALIDRLDQQLWGGEESFLPHGIAGGPHDGLQPVLLTAGQAATNDAACLMAVDGAEISAEEVAALERCCILFDGHDGAAVDAARGQWRSLTSAGCRAQYWSQETGRWAMQAEA